jgi:hypothetical protein
MREDPIEEPAESSVDEKIEKRAEKKRLKKLEESRETGPLDPWERYRILTDLLEQYTDIVEMADRKTRFALVILGALNAVNLLIVARPEIIAGTIVTSSTGMAVYATTYVGLSLFLFIQAIGALKPRISGVVQQAEDKSPDAQNVVGLRFMQNILDVSFEEYYAKWQSAQFGQVNRETALAVRVLARIITEKYAALSRLYAGLQVLVFLTAGLIAALAYARLT